MDQVPHARLRPPSAPSLPLYKRILLAGAALLYASAAVSHFVVPGKYARIVPPYLPWHPFLVYASGVAELAGGIGLLLPAFRRAAAWGLVLLLISVFPANVYMATARIQVTSPPIPPLLLWLRLPLQPVLIYWLLWATKPSREL